VWKRHCGLDPQSFNMRLKIAGQARNDEIGLFHTPWRIVLTPPLTPPFLCHNAGESKALEEASNDCQ